MIAQNKTRLNGKRVFERYAKGTLSGYADSLSLFRKGRGNRNPVIAGSENGV
jgi:hypothetical protein